MKTHQRGFTLVELMITCAVIAILAAVAFPSYTAHVRKSARTAAKAQMMDLANRQQQFLLANRGYATKAQIEATGYVLPNDVLTRYDYAIATAATPPAFTITFTAKGAQLSDGPLTLNSEGGRTPSDKW